MTAIAIPVSAISWGEGVAERPGVDAWPAPLREPAYEGVLGDLVTAIAPHTEADPAALMVQSLVAFGNIIGHRPHCRADGAAHHTNLFAVLVGLTAKGRKGTSWAQARRPFEAVDETFGERVEFGLSSGEGLIYAVRDPVTKGVVTTTEERCRRQAAAGHRG